MSNTKLSQLPQDSSPVKTDFLVGVNGTPQDSKFAISDLACLYNPYKFSAYLSASQTPGAATFTKVQCNTVEFDTGSNYDNVTNFRFTAPVAGFYQFSGKIDTASSQRQVCSLYKNGAEVKRGNDGTGFGQTVGTLLKLNASDYVELWCYLNGSVALGNSGSFDTYFSGFLVSCN